MSFCFQMQAMAIAIYMQNETFQTGKKKMLVSIQHKYFFIYNFEEFIAYHYKD